MLRQRTFAKTQLVSGLGGGLGPRTTDHSRCFGASLAWRPVLAGCRSTHGDGCGVRFPSPRGCSVVATDSLAVAGRSCPFREPWR